MSAEEKAKTSLENQLAEGQRVRNEFFTRQSGEVIAIAKLMGECVGAGNKLLICGNGGSAADSIHFSGEMVGRMMRERRPLPAIALSADISALTAIGNDYGYDHVFVRGVQAFGKRGDILFAISTSGKSPNVLKAVEAAKKIGMTVIALTGGTGGPLGSMADRHLNVALGKNSPRIQEVHIQVIHLLVDLMDEFFLPESQA
ncbi:MAG: D-sedoheptulose-7-phosphate isomerase [Bdellovibrionota bacterium]